MGGRHGRDQADMTGTLDVYRIKGLTGISESAAVQQYMRTGALQFWVAGILMNQWVRQLDYDQLLKDLMSASVVGGFAGGWLQSLDVSLLPKDLVQYYQRAGAAYRNLGAAEAIWETIPAPIRINGHDALRDFHAARDWSHIVPRSMGGGDSASEGIFEMSSLNRARGDATMTPAELDLARQALSMEALRHAVEQAARVAVISGLVAAVVEGVFAIMEEGLLYFDGEISKTEFYSRVLKRLGASVARAFVISGLIVGLVTLCPFLVPVLDVLALPLAVVSFTLLGVRFYRLSKAWRQRVALDPGLSAELLPAWFQDWTWETTKGASISAWDVTVDASLQTWDQTKGVAELVWDARHGVWKGAKGTWERVSGTTKDVSQDASAWAYQWFSARIWESPDLVVNKELMLSSLRRSQPRRFRCGR